MKECLESFCLDNLLPLTVAAPAAMFCSAVESFAYLSACVLEESCVDRTRKNGNNQNPNESIEEIFLRRICCACFTVFLFYLNAK